jgi:hypothetical protein
MLLEDSCVNIDPAIYLYILASAELLGEGVKYFYYIPIDLT